MSKALLILLKLAKRRFSFSFFFFFFLDGLEKLNVNLNSVCFVFLSKYSFHLKCLLQRTEYFVRNMVYKFHPFLEEIEFSKRKRKCRYFFSVGMISTRTAKCKAFVNHFCYTKYHEKLLKFNAEMQLCVSKFAKQCL